MRAHGGYAVPDIHGEVLPQWTVPDKNDYSLGQCDRLRRALKTTQQNVLRALNRARASTLRTGPRVQSAVNYVVGSLKSASLSTVSSTRSDGYSDRNDRKPEVLQIGNVQKGTDDRCLSMESVPVSLATSPDSDTNKLDEEDGCGCEILQGSSSVLSTGWLTLYITLEPIATTPISGDGRVSGKTVSRTGKLCRASTTSQALSPAHAFTTNVIDLDLKDIVTFEEPLDQASADFTFVQKGREDIRVHFTWM